MHFILMMFLQNSWPLKATLGLDLKFLVHLALFDEVIHPPGNAPAVLVELPIKHMAQPFLPLLLEIMILSAEQHQMGKVYGMSF